MQCLSRVISYTVFIAFLYFLTVITHPPTTTILALNPPIFYFLTFAQPIFFFSGWANSPCSSWWPRRRGSTSRTGAWPKNIWIFQQNLHDAHTSLPFPLWILYERRKLKSFWTGGSVSLWNSSMAEMERWRKQGGIFKLPKNCSNWESYEIGQAGELGSRVEDWVDAVGR